MQEQNTILDMLNGRPDQILFNKPSGIVQFVKQQIETNCQEQLCYKSFIIFGVKM